MRPFARYAFVASAVLALLPGLPAYAQGGPGGGGGGGGQSDDDAKKAKRDAEWGTDAKQLDLPQLRNAGPCPYVKVLYDAARYVEVKGGDLSSKNVGFTGEIENLASACEYKSDQPIQVQAQLLFELGRGPQAEGASHVYRYWVAVTDRNRAVLDKEYFDLPVTFLSGQDRVQKTENVFGITIPRADVHVSGANFEVLVGFDVTKQMADMNASGERFLANAGQTQTAAVASGASAGAPSDK
ncbi:MAG TPA: Tat pathway signal sequence domain protein [Caulobacteraceae bacterium]|jgi:hypothetical protein